MQNKQVINQSMICINYTLYYDLESNTLWILLALLFVSAIVYISTNESAQTFTTKSLLPDFTDFGILPFCITDIA